MSQLDQQSADEIVFKREGAVMVSTGDMQGWEGFDYYKDNINDLVARENARVLVLSGCHGDVHPPGHPRAGQPTGDDGVNSIACFKALHGDSHETYGYYKEDAKRFGVESTVTDDPRVYEEQSHTCDKRFPCDHSLKDTACPIVCYEAQCENKDKSYQQVRSIKEILEDQMPKAVANNVLSGLKNRAQVHVLDVAFVHNKPEELIRFIEDFAPTTVIFMWCFSATSYTANLLAKSGIISQIIVEHDKYLLTGVEDRSIIKLGKCPMAGPVRCDKCQADVLHYTEQDIKDTTLEEKWKQGSITTISGPAGSGKTCLGPEVARMIATKRMQEGGGTVHVIFSTSKSYGKALMERMKESGTLGIMAGVKFKYIEDLYRERLHKKWDDDNEKTAEQLEELSKSGDGYVVVVVDELSYEVEYWSCLTCHPGVDQVLLCHPPPDPGDKVPLPRSDQQGVVRHHSLHTSYRQEDRPGRMARFAMTHRHGVRFARHDLNRDPAAAKSWLEENVQEVVEGRSEGEDTLWVEAGKEVDEKVMRRVKQEIGDEKSVTVLYDDEKPPELYSWKYSDVYSFHGSEDEVVVLWMTGDYTRKEEWSRARKRTVLVTREEDREGVWSIMADWEKHESPDYSCEVVEDCPFRGENRPGLEKIFM